VRDVLQNHLTEMMALVAMELSPAATRTKADFLVAKAAFLHQVC
jgi:glucose-6-phosphate 1-dehydrogenase